MILSNNGRGIGFWGLESETTNIGKYLYNTTIIENLTTDWQPNDALYYTNYNPIWNDSVYEFSYNYNNGTSVDLLNLNTDYLVNYTTGNITLIGNYWITGNASNNPGGFIEIKYG